MNQTSYGREGVHSEHLYARGPSRTSSGHICHTLVPSQITDIFYANFIQWAHEGGNCYSTIKLKKYNYRCPYTSNVSNYNRYLHDLLQLVGEEFNDTVITEVRKCSGHKSMKTFERYITFDED